MKTFIAVVVFVLLGVNVFAQADSTKSNKKILVVPYASMMYFSDADADIARFSRLDELKLRNQMRANFEANVYHQLSAKFNAVSLLTATSLNGEEDLKRIYAATQYYSSAAISKNKSIFSSNLFRKKNKKQSFYVSDSATMVAEIQDPNLASNLYKKHQHDYILYITQFEVNTSNKNSIEWVKQEYKRTYIVHYNLWDNKGKLILAEMLFLDAGGENTIKEINDKYFTEIASKLKEIIASAVK